MSVVRVKEGKSVSFTQSQWRHSYESVRPLHKKLTSSLRMYMCSQLLTLQIFGYFLILAYRQLFKLWTLVVPTSHCSIVHIQPPPSSMALYSWDFVDYNGVVENTRRYSYFVWRWAAQNPIFQSGVSNIWFSIRLLADLVDLGWELRNQRLDYE